MFEKNIDLIKNAVSTAHEFSNGLDSNSTPSISQFYLKEKTGLPDNEIMATMLHLRELDEVIIYENQPGTFGLKKSFFKS